MLCSKEVHPGMVPLSGLTTGYIRVNYALDFGTAATASGWKNWSAEQCLLLGFYYYHNSHLCNRGIYNSFITIFLP